MKIVILTGAGISAESGPGRFRNRGWIWARYDMSEVAPPAVMHARDSCPVCRARATLPDVVWFGEIPYHMETDAETLAGVDVFRAIATSGSVYPAAGFVAEARVQGAGTLGMNLAASDNAGAVDEIRLGPATDVVPAWGAERLGG